MAGPVNPHKITRTSVPSTRGLGYHDLREFTSAVPQHRPVPPPTPTGQRASFVQGVIDSIPQQPRRDLRSAVAAFAVGVVAGDRLARKRDRR